VIPLRPALLVVGDNLLEKGVANLSHHRVRFCLLGETDCDDFSAFPGSVSGQNPIAPSGAWLME